MMDSDQPGSGFAWAPQGNRFGRQARRLRRLAVRGFILIVLPAGLLVVAVAGSLATYRAVQAAEGHGVKGYFVSVDRTQGEFRLPDGRVTRPRVTIADPPPGLTSGDIVPALDTGDVTYVFARHGSRHWITNLALMGLVVAALATWAWFVPLRARRRRRAFAACAGPGVGGPGAVLPGQRTVLAAASAPVWSTVTISQLHGDLTTKRVNVALRRAADRAAYPLLVTIGVPLTDFDRAAAPVSGESARLAELTAEVVRLIGGRGALAGTAADSQAWVFLIYTGSHDWLTGFETAVRSAAADHLVAFGVRSDPRWRGYRDLSWGLVRRKRDRVIMLAAFPLAFALMSARYGIIPAAATFVAMEAWTLPLALLPQERAVAAQLRHPAASFLTLCGMFLTLFFPLGAMMVHPASPWVCAAGAAAVAVALVAVLWPAQRRFYARMRTRDALRPPPAPR